MKKNMESKMKTQKTILLFTAAALIGFSIPSYADRGSAISDLVSRLRAASHSSIEVSGKLGSMWRRQSEMLGVDVKEADTVFADVDLKHHIRVYYKDIVDDDKFRKFAVEKMGVILSESTALPGKIRAYYDILHEARNSRRVLADSSNNVMKQAYLIAPDLITLPIRQVLAEQITKMYPNLADAKMLRHRDGNPRSFRTHQPADFLDVRYRNEIESFYDNDFTTLVLGRLGARTMSEEGSAILPNSLSGRNMSVYDNMMDSLNINTNGGWDLSTPSSVFQRRLLEIDPTIQSYSDLVDTTFTGIWGTIKLGSELRLAISAQQAGFDAQVLQQLTHELQSAIHQFGKNLFSMPFNGVSPQIIDRVSFAFFEINGIADTMLVVGREHYTSNGRVVRFLNQLPLNDRLRILDSSEFESFARNRSGLMAELEGSLEIN